MGKKMTEQEKKDWDELYQYVKKDILEYDEEKKMPQNLVLRLLGLKEGKFICNDNTKCQACYPFKIILLTFKINKLVLVYALENKSKFKDEKHMINYMMSIVESKINDTYDRYKRIELEKALAESIDITVNENKQEYKQKTKKVNNSRLKGLL